MEKNDFWGQFLQYAQISLTCFFRYFRNILSPLTWLQKVQAIWESQIFNLSEKMLTCKRQRGLSGSVQWWDSSTSLGILFRLPVPFYYRGSSHHLQMTCPEVFHHNFTQVSEKMSACKGQRGLSGSVSESDVFIERPLKMTSFIVKHGCGQPLTATR